MGSPHDHVTYRMEIQRVSVDLAQRRVEFANIRLTQGAANSNRDVVEEGFELVALQRAGKMRGLKQCFAALGWCLLSGHAAAY